MGWTEIPPIFAVITPGILYLLLPIIRKLPKGDTHCHLRRLEQFDFCHLLYNSVNL